MGVTSHILRWIRPIKQDCGGLGAKALSAPRLETMRPRIQQIANELVARVPINWSSQPFDGSSRAYHSPWIAELLGAPLTEREVCSDGSTSISGGTEGDAARTHRH